MKLFRWLTRGYHDGRIVEPGESVLVADSVIPGPHMVDVEAESKAMVAAGTPAEETPGGVMERDAADRREFLRVERERAAAAPNPAPAPGYPVPDDLPNAPSFLSPRPPSPPRGEAFNDPGHAFAGSPASYGQGADKAAADSAEGKATSDKTAADAAEAKVATDKAAADAAEKQAKTDAAAAAPAPPVA